MTLTRLTPLAALLLTSAAFGQTTTLQEVRIVGAADQGYAPAASATATKTDSALLDTPQAVTVVTRQLIEDQAMQSMADVIRYVPGVVPAQGEGNRDTAVFRGNSSTGDFFVDGMRDDLQYFRDLYNIDSVEALKGANAMIFGRGGAGGVLNRVTKTPQWTPRRAASLTLGSWADRRATVDLGSVLSPGAAFRLNAMAEDADSYRAGATLRRWGLNPTLALRAGSNTSVVLGYEHFKDQRTADRGVTSWNGRPVAVDPATFFGSSSLSHTYARVDALSALVEHDLGQGALLRNRTRVAAYDKFYQNVFAGSVVRVENGVPTLNLAGYNNRTQRQNVFNQTDLSFSIAQGALRHKIATGIELGRQVTDNYRNSAYFTDLGASATAFPVRLADPAFHGAVAFRQSASDADNHGVATVASAYVQDQLELAPQWQLIGGLRYDRFKVDFDNHRTGANLAHTDTPLAPRAGVVYKPRANVAVYGSYSVAYLPRAGDQLSSLSATNASFDPERFRNLELGAKWDVQSGLQATAAVYRLERSNVLVPAVLGSDPTSVLADGQRTKGVELGLSGRLTSAWSIMGGYAWQDAKLTADVSAKARNGATLAQVPRHAASLWNRYDFTPALGAGLGIVYRGAIFSSTSNAVTLPAFTRVDGALYWTLNPRYRLQLNVENLFDRHYFASANSDTNITPGAPRNLRLTLTAAF